MTYQVGQYLIVILGPEVEKLAHNQTKIKMLKNVMEYNVIWTQHALNKLKGI